MILITRRHFLKYSAGASTALVLPWTVRQAFAAKPARSLLKYIQPLPVPGNGIVVATPSGMNHILLHANRDHAAAASSFAADTILGV